MGGVRKARVDCNDLEFECFTALVARYSPSRLVFIVDRVYVDALPISFSQRWCYGMGLIQSVRVLKTTFACDYQYTIYIYVTYIILSLKVESCYSNCMRSVHASSSDDRLVRDII